MQDRKEQLINSALESAIPMVNEYIARYACQVRTLCLVNGTIQASISLEGLEDREIAVTCSDITISDDYDSFRIGSFCSNMPFMQKLLTKYAVRDIPVSHEFGQVGLLFLKSVL